jgi:hypothetical protein
LELYRQVSVAFSDKGNQSQMTYPEQALLKRRRQILDDETGDSQSFNTPPPDNTWARETAWAKNFVSRLGEVVRKLGRGK